MGLQTDRSKIYTVLSGLFLLTSLLLSGCKGMNDDPAEKKGSLTIDLKKIQHQLGYTDQQISNSGSISSTLTQPTDTPATSAANILILGALVVNSRDTPYSPYEPLTGTMKDDLEADLTNSADFIKTIILPTSSEFVEFELPPEGANDWQVLAAAANYPSLEGDTPPTLQEATEGDILYAGYSSRLYNTADVLKNGISEILTLQRNCFNDVVANGCATYGASITDTPIVKAAVEIVGVKINGEAQSHADLPFIVRDPPSVGKQVTASTAQGYLVNIRTSFGDPSTISSLTVITTHTKNPAESAGCRAYGDSTNDTTSDIMGACENQKYKILIQ